MIKKIEKTAEFLICASLAIIFLSWLLPVEPVSSDSVTVTATVSSTMVSCTSPAGSIAFEANLDNLTIGTTTNDATTTCSSSGAFYLKVYDTGTDTSASPPCLSGAAATAIIESPESTYALATATLVAGTEGYGMQASSTGPNLLINERYEYASATNDIVGGLGTSTSEYTVASTDAAITGEVVATTFKAAVAIITPGGSYSDTITFTCSAAP